MQIFCLGDSITDSGHLFINPPLGDGYVHKLSLKLQQRGTNCSITNLGMNGFTISRLLDSTLPRLPKQTDIITVLIGINDIGLMMNTFRTPQQQTEMMALFFEKYRELLQLLVPKTSCLILMEPFIFPFPAEYQNWIPYVKTMSEGIEKLACEYHLPYLLLHDDLNAAAAWYRADALTEDGIHLTSAGYEIITEKLFALLQRSLSL